MDVFNAADLRRLLTQSGKDISSGLKEFSCIDEVSALPWEKVELS